MNVADILTKHGADEDAHTKVPLTTVIVRVLPDLEGPSSPIKPPESTPRSSEGILSCLRASCPQICIEAPFLLELSPARCHPDQKTPPCRPELPSLPSRPARRACCALAGLAHPTPLAGKACPSLAWAPQPMLLRSHHVLRSCWTPPPPPLFTDPLICVVL